jgi:hypothetical protein
MNDDLKELAHDIFSLCDGHFYGDVIDYDGLIEALVEWFEKNGLRITMM